MPRLLVLSWRCKSEPDVTHDAQYFSAVATANAVFVFTKAHIEHPMQPILYPSVVTYRMAKLLRIGGQAGDEISPLNGAFAAPVGLILHHTDDREVPPSARAWPIHSSPHSPNSGALRCIHDLCPFVHSNHARRA